MKDAATPDGDEKPADASEPEAEVAEKDDEDKAAAGGEEESKGSGKEE